MSDHKSKHTWWCITKIAAAIIFSYPLCGVAAAAWMLFRDFPSTIRHPGQSLLDAIYDSHLVWRLSSSAWRAAGG
jgi:ABC-type Fe3+ transport system permease subunit